MSTPETSELIAEIVPQIYAGIIENLHLHPNTDVSRGNKCHALTTDLIRALAARGMQGRRELHVAGEDWHYVVNHAPIDQPPAENDIITDLNPWMGEGGEAFTGYLHGPRHEVIATLQAARYSEDYVSLRGLATIARAHDERFWPFSQE